MSDHQTIETTRRSLRWQRPAGVLLLAVSVVSWIAGFYAYDRIEDLSGTVVESLAGTKDEELKKSSLQTSYQLGVSQGLRLGALVGMGAVLLHLGVSLVSSRKKDKLLIKYYDLATQQLVGSSKGQDAANETKRHALIARVNQWLSKGHS